jgi:pyrroloquinoline quinone (PQQ) biosynthesis protein C
MTNTTTELDTIVQTLVETLKAHPFASRMIAGTVTREDYAAFLLQTYLYVVHTRPLLHRAGERLARMGQTAMGQLFMHKAAEEEGHETWLVEDLVAIGEKPERVHEEKPVPAVRRFVTWNSFVVEHGLPVGILGAAYVLEAISAQHAHEVAKNLCQHSGISGVHKGVRFLTGHGDADVDHIAALGRVIESIAAVPAQRDAILMTARVTKSTYLGLYTALGMRNAAREARLEVNPAT